MLFLSGFEIYSLWVPLILGNAFNFPEVYSVLGSVLNSGNCLLIPRSVFNHYDVLNSC